MKVIKKIVSYNQAVLLIVYDVKQILLTNSKIQFNKLLLINRLSARLADVTDRPKGTFDFTKSARKMLLQNWVKSILTIKETYSKEEKGKFFTNAYGQHPPPLPSLQSAWPLSALFFTPSLNAFWRFLSNFFMNRLIVEGVINVIFGGFEILSHFYMSPLVKLNVVLGFNFLITFLIPF